MTVWPIFGGGFSMGQLYFSHHGKVPLLAIDILIKLFNGSDQWPVTYGLLFDCTQKKKTPRLVWMVCHQKVGPTITLF
jgi:hypothetical protein